MQLLIAYRRILLLVAVIAVVAAIPVSDRLRFDQRIETFFAEENSDLQILRQSRRDFGGQEFVIVAWTESRLFEVGDLPYPNSLNEVLEVDILPAVTSSVSERLKSVAEQLNDIPGVRGERTQHLASFLQAAPRFKPARRAMLRLFEGTLVGHDGRTTGILLELLPEPQAAVSRRETLRRIRTVARQLEGEVAVAGEPVQVQDMFRMVEEDGRTLFLVSLGILAAVLLLMFRGIRWVLAPVGLVLGAVIITRATLVLVGAELSMVSSMLNSLVTVIGIASCMHIIVHYRDLRSQMTNSQQEAHEQPDQFSGAALQTLREMAAPIFWTCVTTAVGFGSLLVSQITPVRSFAVMMCLATGIILPGFALILPATLRSGSRLRPPATVPLEHWLDRILQFCCGAVEKRPILTASLCFSMLIAAVPGIFALTIETDFSRNFKESSTIVQSLRFVESRLGGAGSWEVSFDTPEKLTDDFLEKVGDLADRLRVQHADDTDLRVLSLTDLADLPPRILGPARTLRRIRRDQPDLIANFYNEEACRMRIVLRSAEQQSSEKKLAQIASVRQCVRDFFADHPELEQQSTAEASGMFVLLAEVIRSLLSDQLRSFLVASAGILLCMTVAFRSLRIGLISLFPNMFPVAVVMGALGWIGEPVNIGTAMITSVSMGLTVDSTIHYITAFERARRTRSVSEAISVAHAGAGRAVVFAHLALIAGFLVLTASRFIPLVYFGALLSLSMIGGIFGDLILLPVLLRWSTRDTFSTSERSDEDR